MAEAATHKFPVIGTQEREREGLRLGSAGLMLEALGGVGAIVLSILGLLHILPVLLASIATIVVGASFLIAGGTMASRLARFGAQAEAPALGESIGEGMAMESLTGAAGVVLGILALVGAGATTLLPIAAIVYGAGLLVGSGAATRFERFRTREYAVELWVGMAANPSVLIALSGVVLGILGLASLSPIILSLIAMLSFGVAVLLSGTSVASRVLAVV